MPTSRRFAWTYAPPDGAQAPLLCAQARGVAGVFCTDWSQWYSGSWVSGEAFGIVNVGITVTSRDQWWVQKRVRKFLSALARHTDIPVLEFTEVKEKLPPHPNRGKAFRKEKVSGRTD